MMKKVILTLLALFVAQSTFAQIVSSNDPVGTKYIFETEIGGLKLSLEQTLLSIEDGKFSFKSVQEMPQPFGTMELENSCIVKDGMIIETLAEKQKAIETQLASMGANGAKVTIEGDINAIPLSGKVGDEFALTSHTINMTVMGMDQKMESKITSYKVIAEETLATPAGTFETFVVEAVGETSVSTMGQSQKVATSTKYWIVEGMGVVKSVIDDGSGNITTQTLKSIVKP